MADKQKPTYEELEAQNRKFMDALINIAEAGHLAHAKELAEAVLPKESER